ncbi:MAG TPA: TRAP transporter substrate-binding protein, partial [Geminicoccaceae bacterium]|nr:TRAP transporter substrate-binding protein [Geminicoccaceae bacterium]
MRRRVFALLASAVIPGLVLLGTAGGARAEIGEHTIKFATQNSKGHPSVEGMEKFKELVEERSDGNITVRLFPGGVLGGDLQTISALQGGTVEMTVLNAGLMAGVAKDFALADLPFLYETPEQADAVMDGPFGAALTAQLPEHNLAGLGYWELGFRQLTNNRHPVNTVDDIAGLKIRVVQQPVMIDLFNALGANAVPMPFPEVYTALETGTVDGQENPFPNILASKFYEVQDHLAITNHVYNPQVVLVSGKLWDQLNAEERKLLQDAAVEARDFQRATSRAQSEEALAQLKEEGMEVTELPPAEMAKLREKAKPVVEAQKQAASPELVKLL